MQLNLLRGGRCQSCDLVPKNPSLIRTQKLGWPWNLYYVIMLLPNDGALQKKSLASMNQ